MLGTCIFCEGGVMILWLGPLVRCVGASVHAIALFCIGCGCVLGLYSDTLHFVFKMHVLTSVPYYIWLRCHVSVILTFFGEFSSPVCLPRPALRAEEKDNIEG